MRTPWFPLFAADLLISTAPMSPSCFGCYMRLLCFAWTEGGLPNDYEACSRIAGGMTLAEWAEIRLRLSVKADPDTAAERLVHARMERERDKVGVARSSRQEAAARTNSARRLRAETAAESQLARISERGKQ